MHFEQAAIPLFLKIKGNTLINNLLSLFCGVGLLALLAQLSVPLPWTPVPITGQTFGIALISLLWGRIRGFSIMAFYLFIGAMGAPVFSIANSSLIMRPTLGYLIGMLLASYVMGSLSDRGWCKNFWSTYLTTLIGSLIIFAFGVLVLSYYLPAKDLLFTGVVPFLPGDFIKNILASSIAYNANKKLRVLK